MGSQQEVVLSPQRNDCKKSSLVAGEARTHEQAVSEQRFRLIGASHDAPTKTPRVEEAEGSISAQTKDKKESSAYIHGCARANITTSADGLVGAVFL